MAIPENNATYNQMLNKQSFTDIQPKESFENEFEDFIRDATNEVGDYIVENAINEIEDLGVDATIFDGDVPEIAEVLYDNKIQSSYVYNVKEEELRRVMNDKAAYDEMNNRIKGNLDEQDRKNCYRLIPALISDTSYFKASQINSTITSKTDFAGILKAMRNAVYKLKQPTDSYNAYTKTVQTGSTPQETTTYTLKTFTRRAAIFLPYDLYNAISVDYESGVRNLEKIAVNADIYVVPALYTDASVQTFNNQSIKDYSVLEEDPNKLFIVAGKEWVKVYRHFVRYVNFEDLRSLRRGKAVTYKAYTSKLTPAIVYKLGGAAAASINAVAKGK